MTSLRWVEPRRALRVLRLGTAGCAIALAMGPVGSLRAEAPAVADALPEVTVRSGQHPTFVRFVLDWASDVGFAVEREGGQTVVRFDRPARFRPDGSVPEGRLAVSADGRAIVLDVPAETTVRSFALDDHRVVVDVLMVGGAATTPANDVDDAQLDGALAPPATTSLPPDADDSTLVPFGFLKTELYRRDMMIASLLARLEAVEGGWSVPAAAATPMNGTSGATLATVSPASGEGAMNGAGPAMAQAAAGEGDGSPGGEAAPGTGDEGPPEREVVERALERTLTQAGALLLQPGQLEVTPGITYTRRTTNSPVFVSGADDGIVFVGEDEVERDEVRAMAELKLGLPFDSQVELALPVNYVDQSVRTMIGGSVGDAESGDGVGIGNPRLSLAKTLAREAGWRPDLIITGYWDTRFGEADNNNVALTSNFNEFGLSLSAVKRQDPLAFVGGVGVARALENDGINPGDTFSFSASAVLAASPLTSLRLGFSQQFTTESELDNDKIDGSDQTSGTMTIGASAILGSRALVDVALDVGLTDDAPDYAIRMSLPIRFDLPIF